MRESLKVAVKMFPGSVVIAVLHWLRDPKSFTCMLAGSLNSSPCRLVHRAAHNMRAGFPRVNELRERERENYIKIQVLGGV